MRLTEAGERYFELISEDVEHILDATDQMRGAVKTKLLTVRATPTISTKWLLPRLPDFLAANPDLDLRLDGTNEPTDFNRENVDIEIRHGTGRWTGLHIQALTEESFFPVCSPALAQAGTLRADELQRHRLIYSVKAQIQWPAWFERLGLEREGPWKKVYFDRSHMAVDAAVAGMGIALESNLMMERELREGKLVLPMLNAPSVQLSTQWLVCPFNNLRRRRVRRFVDWIVQAAEEWSRFSGTSL
jgi:LysR family transcriptional regulator, glycine cleavage system transcriptional activator